MPALSCVALFVLQHWVFSIGVFLSGLWSLLLLPLLRTFQRLPDSLVFVGYCQFLLGVAGRIVLVFGTAAVLAPSVLSWQFPVIAAGAFIATMMANPLMGWVMGILAWIMMRDSSG